MRRPLILAVALVAAGITWYLFRPERLFTTTRVNEALPEVAAAATTSDAMGGSAMGGSAMGGEATSGSAMGGDAVATPAAAAAVLATGTFHSNAHPTAGSATIHRLADGRRVLRLTGFSTSNGPDVQVYLVAAGDVTDDATVERAGFVNVGALKGNVGDQNYELPAELDLGTYRAVTIWCRRFSVNFGTAPLAAPAS